MSTKKERLEWTDRLLRAWDHVPCLTLGRLISNVEFIEGEHLRGISDEDLVTTAELFVSTQAVKVKR